MFPLRRLGNATNGTRTYHQHGTCHENREEHQHRAMESKNREQGTGHGTTEHRKHLGWNRQCDSYAPLHACRRLGEDETEQHRVNQRERQTDKRIGNHHDPIVVGQRHRQYAQADEQVGEAHGWPDRNLIAESAGKQRSYKHHQRYAAADESDEGRIGPARHQMQLDGILDAIDAEIDERRHDEHDHQRLPTQRP